MVREGFHSFANLEGIQSTNYIIDIVSASITGQSSDSLVWFSVAQQEHTITYNTIIADQYNEVRIPYYVNVNNNGFTMNGYWDSLLQEEGSVVLFASSTSECTFNFLANHSMTSPLASFIVTIVSEQYVPINAIVHLMSGNSIVLTKSITITDSITDVVFTSDMEGWNQLTSNDIYYSITIQASSSSMFTLKRVFSVASYNMNHEESFKYVENDCSEEPIASTIMIPNDDSEITWNFTHGSNNNVWKLCYRIGLSSFVNAGVDYDMRVGEVTGLQTDIGSKERVVVGIPKTFSIEGSWIQENDQVYFNKNTILTPTYNVNSNHSVTIMNEEILTSEPMTLNYKFNSMPYQAYPYSITQSYISSTTISGEEGHAVIGNEITITIEGNGFLENDKVYVVDATSSCDTMINEYLTSATYDITNTQMIATLVLSNATSGKNLKYCYSFDGEGAIAISESFITMELTSISIDGEGSINIAVATQPKRMILTGNGLRVGDIVSFHATNDCSTPAIASFTVEQDEHNYTVTYLFTAGSNGAEYSMCYTFGTSATHLYADYSIIVKSFNGFISTTVESDVTSFVVHNPKQVNVVVDGFTTGDQLGFTATKGDCSDLLMMVIDGEQKTLLTLQTISTTVTIWSEITTGSMYVCYKFGDEPITPLTQEYILYILSVSVDEGYDKSSIVAGQDKTCDFERSSINA